MKTLNIIAFIIASIVCSIVGAQTTLGNVTQKYDAYLKAMNQGTCILVKQNGKTQVAQMGNFNFNEHTVFNIGSATKKMTAILVLQEAEKGQLKLSDSIGMYLDPIRNVDMSLSIETLLRHESGLGELVGESFERDFMMQSDSIYNRNALDFIPEGHPEQVGKYKYCNTNYIIVGRLLEKVTDKSYFDLLETQILEPAGMTSSAPYVSKHMKNLATPTHKSQDVSEYLDYRFFANFAYSAGSVASTLHDMDLFHQHLYEKNTLLSEASLKQLLSFGDTSDYGLGVMKLDNGFIGHGGNNLGYSYREYYRPEDKTLVMLFSNNMRITFNKMLKHDLMLLLEGKSADVAFNPNINQEFESVVGNYLFDTQGMKLELEIKQDGGLYFLHVQGQKVLLVSTETNKLTNGATGIELERNPKDASYLTFRQNGLETQITRVASH